jgi:dTDP-4-dehydrorhamnose reductase
MIVVIGKSGQLAQELNITKGKRDVVFLGRNEVNVFDSLKFASVINQYRPTVIINASAYTAVDRAEKDVEAAFALNRNAVKTIASYCQQSICRLVHVSTDFVFDGNKSEPYNISDSTNPLNVYGRSKLAGEHAIQSKLANDYAIVRTSWLYSSFGSNFVKTMLHLMNERDEIYIVGDQIGSPTYARGLAEYIWTLTQMKNIAPIHHYSDVGEISWYDFACEIYRLGKLHRLIKRDVDLKPISTNEYPTLAKRPRYSVLNCAKTNNTYYGDMLGFMFKNLKENAKDVFNITSI